MAGTYIKDLEKKINIDGTESILVQDSNGTKQLDINTLLNNNNNNIDLSNYATKTELNNKANKSHTHTTNDITNLSVPTKTSQLTNDSGFITSIPSEYVTENELNSKKYVTQSQIPTSLPANGGNADTVGGYTIWVGTQAQYDALTTKYNTTIYLIKEE